MRTVIKNWQGGDMYCWHEMKLKPVYCVSYKSIRNNKNDIISLKTVKTINL